MQASLAFHLSSGREVAGAALWEILSVDGSHPPQPPSRITNAWAYSVVKRGISSKAIDPLSTFLGLGKGVVTEYLDLDRATTHRRAARDQLLPTHAAESLLRLIELHQLAWDTFETEAESGEWLKRPHPMLDGESPLQAAKTSYGAQRVKDILLTIKYGGAL